MLALGPDTKAEKNFAAPPRGTTNAVLLVAVALGGLAVGSLITGLSLGLSLRRNDDDDSGLTSASGSAAMAGTSDAVALAGTQAAWDNHFSAFGAQDLDEIMLDYTDASILNSYEYCSGVLTTAVGLSEIRSFFDGLFTTLSDTSDLAAPVIKVTGVNSRCAQRCGECDRGVKGVQREVQRARGEQSR